VGEALSAMGINGPFLISQLVNFLVLFGALTFLIWRPARKRLDERQAALQKQAEDAQAAEEQLAKIDQEREKVLQEAKKEAEQIVSQAQERIEVMKKKASEEAKEIVQKARVDAKEEEKRQLKGMRDQVAMLAIAAAQKLLGAALDEKRQRALIDEFFSSAKDGEVIVLEGEELKGKSAVVTSALPLNQKEKDIIQKDLLKKAAGDMGVAFEVDPGILGGLTIQVDDKMYDHSVLTQLAGLRTRFT
jgi:F-type H+-transporting ATPase subunit b